MAILCFYNNFKLSWRSPIQHHSHIRSSHVIRFKQPMLMPVHMTLSSADRVFNVPCHQLLGDDKDRTMPCNQAQESTSEFKRPFIAHYPVQFSRLTVFCCSTSTDPLTHYGWHFGHVTFAFCNFKSLLTNGLALMAESTPLNSLSPW